MRRGDASRDANGKSRLRLAGQPALEKRYEIAAAALDQGSADVDAGGHQAQRHNQANTREQRDDLERLVVSRDLGKRNDRNRSHGSPLFVGSEVHSGPEIVRPMY
jgi:hypothetical protein